MNSFSLHALIFTWLLALALPIGAAQDSAVPHNRRIGVPWFSTLMTAQKGASQKAQGEGFGASLTSIGDLDGNGTTDVAVGSPLADNGGALWILFLQANGEVLRSQRIESGSAGMASGLASDARFGTSVAFLGASHQEGLWDLAVGAPGSKGLGQVWMLSIDSGGLVQNQRKLELEPASGSIANGSGRGAVPKNSSPAPTLSQRSPFDGFGQSLAAPGDLDGDGHADLVVGAPFDDDGGNARGALWIFGLSAERQVLTQQKISHTQGFFSGGLSDWDRFGYAITKLGDLDGDGRSELAVGAPGSRGRSREAFHSRGALWILFLGKQGGVRRHRRIDVPIHGDRLASDGAAILFGSSLAALGDLNADGIPDLAVGAPRAGEEQQGDLWLLLMRPDGSALAHERLSEREPWVSQALQPGAGLGQAMALVDDLDGNGRADLMVATTLDEAASADQGALWNLLLEGCFSASVSLRKGDGLNPRSLSTDGLPRRGNPWNLSLDCSDNGMGIATILGRTRPSVGISTEAGELLVDLSPASFAFLLQAPHQSNKINFTLMIPLDTTSCNMSLYVQGFCSSEHGGRFSNALDLIIGR